MRRSGRRWTTPTSSRGPHAAQDLHGRAKRISRDQERTIPSCSARSSTRSPQERDEPVALPRMCPSEPTSLGWLASFLRPARHASPESKALGVGPARARRPTSFPNAGPVRAAEGLHHAASGRVGWRARRAHRSAIVGTRHHGPRDRLRTACLWWVLGRQHRVCACEARGRHPRALEPSTTRASRSDRRRPRGRAPAS